MTLTSKYISDFARTHFQTLLVSYQSENSIQSVAFFFCVCLACHFNETLLSNPPISTLFNRIDSHTDQSNAQPDLGEQAALLVTHKLSELQLSSDAWPRRQPSNSPTLLGLITSLTHLFLQLRDLALAAAADNGPLFPHQFTQLISDKIAEVRASLVSDRNAALFEDKVQVHINHIQATLCRFNKLQAFRPDLAGRENESERVFSTR